MRNETHQVQEKTGNKKLLSSPVSTWAFAAFLSLPRPGWLFAAVRRKGHYRLLEEEESGIASFAGWGQFCCCFCCLEKVSGNSDLAAREPGPHCVPTSAPQASRTPTKSALDTQTLPPPSLAVSGKGLRQLQIGKDQHNTFLNLQPILYCSLQTCYKH